MQSGIFLLLSSIKQPLGLPVFLNGVSLVVGFLYLVDKYKINIVYGYFALFLLCGLMGNVFHGFDAVSFTRTVQVVFLVLFSVYLISNVHRLGYKYYWVVFVFFLLVFIFELMFNVRYVRGIAGFAVPRLAGVHGDPNYNSILMAVFFILTVINSRCSKILSFCFCLLILPGFSRGAIAGVSIFLITAVLHSKAPRLISVLSFFGLLLLFSQPLVLDYIMFSLDPVDIKAINVLSSDRLAHWNAYYEMGKQNPFGVGYFIGQTLEWSYINSELFDKVKPQQAHSMYFSVIADFGILGYAILFLAFIKMFRVSKSSAFRLATFNFIVLGFMSLNFLGEVSFWILVSIVLSNKFWERSNYEVSY